MNSARTVYYSRPSHNSAPESPLSRRSEHRSPYDLSRQYVMASTGLRGAIGCQCNRLKCIAWTHLGSTKLELAMSRIVRPQDIVLGSTVATISRRKSDVCWV